MENAKDSQKFKSFALAFLKEAKEDLEVAKELIENKRYARSVSSSQQSVEKSIKALLEMEHIFIAEHDLSSFFVKFIYNNKKYASFKDELNELLSILDYFEGEWSKTRYPREKKGKVETPVEIYKSKDAVIAFEKASQCYGIIKTIFIKKFKFVFKN